MPGAPSGFLNNRTEEFLQGLKPIRFRGYMPGLKPRPP